MAERWPFQSPARPGLDVSGEGRGCNTLSGRFVVRDVAYGPGGDVQRFAADFEQHCEEGPRALTGSMLYRSGDAACASAAHGSACDDLDACTGSSSCQAGICTGMSAVACPVADDGCHQTGLCDPASGACATALGVEGAICTPTDACTTGMGTCTAGRCVAQPLVCDDGDVCSDDACDPAAGQCAFTAAPCWSLIGRTTGTASIPGRSVTRSRRFTGLLVLRGNGTYRAPGGLETCPTGNVEIPDEVGTVRPWSRGRLLLEPSNLGDLLVATQRCVGYPVVLKSYRAWVKPLPTGVQLHGGARLTARVHARGQTISVVAVSRFVGTRRSSAAPSAQTNPTAANASTVAESRLELDR